MNEKNIEDFEIDQFDQVFFTFPDRPSKFFGHGTPRPKSTSHEKQGLTFFCPIRIVFATLKLWNVVSVCCKSASEEVYHVILPKLSFLFFMCEVCGFAARKS